MQGRRTELGLGWPTAWMDAGLIRTGHTVLGWTQLLAWDTWSSHCAELSNQGQGSPLTQGQRTCGVRNQVARANTLFSRRLVKLGMVSSVTGISMLGYRPFVGGPGKTGSPSQ